MLAALPLSCRRSHIVSFGNTYSRKINISTFRQQSTKPMQIDSKTRCRSHAIDQTKTRRNRKQKVSTKHINFVWADLNSRPKLTTHEKKRFKQTWSISFQRSQFLTDFTLQSIRSIEMFCLPLTSFHKPHFALQFYVGNQTNDTASAVPTEKSLNMHEHTDTLVCAESENQT